MKDETTWEIYTNNYVMKENDVKCGKWSGNTMKKECRI